MDAELLSAALATADGIYWNMHSNFYIIGLPSASLTACAMGDAPREVNIRHIGNCLKADPAYGEGVADALKIPISEVPADMEPQAVAAL